MSEEVKRYSGNYYEDASGDFVKLEDIRIEHFLHNEEIKLLFDSKKRASKILTMLQSERQARLSAETKLRELQDAVQFYFYEEGNGSYSATSSFIGKGQCKDNDVLINAIQESQTRNKTAS